MLLLQLFRDSFEIQNPMTDTLDYYATVNHFLLDPRMIVQNRASVDKEKKCSTDVEENP